MTWKISSRGRFGEFRGTCAWALKKNVGMTALLAVLLFLCLPLPTMMEISRIGQDASLKASARPAELALRCPEFVKAEILLFGVTLLLVFSVVFCVRLFGYLQNRRSVDLFHSLPVGRVPMLLGRWCAGMAALAAPVLVNFLILRLVLLSAGVPPLAGEMNLWSAMLWLLLMTAAAFTFCTFLAVCSGSVMDTVLSVLGISAGFPVCVLLCVQLVQYTLPGAAFDWWFAYLPVATLLAPFPAAYLPFAQGTVPMPAWFLPWWICVTAALLAGACLIYRRRKSEAAEDPAAFPIPKTAVRFLLTAAVGIGVGFTMMGGGVFSFFVGVLAGSAAAHVVVEALYARGFSTLKKSAKWYAAFAACFLAFYGVITTGCFGYDTRVPAASEVESVSAGVVGGQRQFILSNSENRSVTLQPVLKRPESIRTVLQIHKSIIGLSRENNYPYVPRNISGARLTLSYRLKNGRTLVREYAFPFGPDNSLFEKNWDAITGMLEYRQKDDLVFYLQPYDMKSFTVNTGGQDERTATFSKIDEKAEMLAALRENCLENPGAGVNDSKDSCSVTVTWAKEITPSASLREALGGCAGTIRADGGEYAYRTGDRVDMEVKKLQKQQEYRYLMQKKAEIEKRLGKSRK